MRTKNLLGIKTQTATGLIPDIGYAVDETSTESLAPPGIRAITVRNSWKTYEQVAEYLLNQFAAHFKLGRVEGKQIVPGESGTEWEIDAKGVKSDGGGFLVVECRRYTNSRLNQESMAALAFRIQDTGASGGIVVSPLGLQSGAKKVAGHSNIQHVMLDPKSTTADYMMKFLNDIFIGLSDSVTVTDSLHIQIIRDGKVIDERKA